MTLRRALPLLLILPILLLAACGDDDSDTTAAEGPTGSSETQTTEATTEGQPTGNAPAPSGEAERSAKVEISGFEFVPSKVTIQAGGKVIWMNEDADEHTATLDDGSFSTGPLAEGKLKSESFKTPGTYTYYCEIHPDMKGVVEVVEPS